MTSWISKSKDGKMKDWQNLKREMAENFSDALKDMKSQIQGQIVTRINKSNPKHITVKLQNTTKR